VVVWDNVVSRAVHQHDWAADVRREADSVANREFVFREIVSGPVDAYLVYPGDARAGDGSGEGLRREDCHQHRDVAALAAAECEQAPSIQAGEHAQRLAHCIEAVYDLDMAGVVWNAAAEAGHRVAIIAALAEFGGHAEQIVAIGKVAHQVGILKTVAAPAVAAMEQASVWRELVGRYNPGRYPFGVVDGVGAEKGQVNSSMGGFFHF